MIVGIGVDIVEVKRIENVYCKFGNEFLKKILSNYEIQNIINIPNTNLKVKKIASRFAAKEAILKSLSYLKKKPSFLDFEILSESSGKPFVKFTKKKPSSISREFQNNFKLDISLSHENNYAVAFATLSKIHYEKKKKFI